MGNGVKIIKRFLLGMLPVLAGVATAATFNLFSPATGILKGNASTYVTTAATSTDVIATFTGTCNNGTYLRGDGTCNTPPGTGVSSVGLTMPSGFSVGGSPVTSSGTLAVTTALNGVLKGNGTGFTTAISTDISGLFGCTLVGQYLAGNGSCQTVPTSPVGANPSASVGLSAVNGVATTFMRSDGAPALSQSITPTWSGVHVFSAVGSDAVPTILMSSTLPIFSMKNTGSGVDEKQWDIDVFGNTIFFYSINDATNNAHTWLKSSRTGAAITDITFGNNTDNPTYTFPSTGTTAFSGNVTVAGSSVCRANGTNCPSAGATVTTGSFTTTWDDACTTSPTTDWHYIAVSQGGASMVTLVPFSTSGFSCTSDSTSFAESGTSVPAAIRPTNTRRVSAVMNGGLDNGTATAITYTISSGGSLSISTSASGATGIWTNSGTKSGGGAINPAPFTYSTDN